MSNATPPLDAPMLMTQFRCPNGLLVWSTPDAGRDTRFLYTEVFEQRCYERHGVTVRDGDVVLDIGANVGFFTLSIMERFRRLKVVCVEPVPHIRQCLERNIAESPVRGDHQVAILPNAMGASNGDAMMSYFPQAPANSTMHLEEKRREWATIVHEITFRQLWNRNKFLALLLLFVFPWRRRIFTRFVAPVFDDVVEVPCIVRRLSDSIRELGLDRVDLLKIDVEGAELEVLEGIDDEHWPLINQLAMEVPHAHKGALGALRERLQKLGFTKIEVESMLAAPAVLEDPMPCTLYAVRSAL